MSEMLLQNLWKTIISTDQIKQFRIMNYKLFFICSESNTILLQLFLKPFITHMFQNKIRFLKLTKLQWKQQPKWGMLRLLLSLLRELRLLHRISPLGLFYSKSKIRYSLVSIVLRCFDFYFQYTRLNNLHFLCYKEQQEQHKTTVCSCHVMYTFQSGWVFVYKLNGCGFESSCMQHLYNISCTTEGKKSKKCCVRNHTILFFCLRGTAQEVISLFILRENSLSERDILGNTIFYEIINQSKFFFTTLTRLRCLEH